MAIGYQISVYRAVSNVRVGAAAVRYMITNLPKLRANTNYFSARAAGRRPCVHNRNTPANSNFSFNIFGIPL